MDSVARIRKMGDNYKSSELGVIPASWEITGLSELGSWKGGITPSMNNEAYWLNGEVFWLSSGDIKSPLINESSHKITKHALRNSGAFLIPENSILFVTRSGILRKYLPVAKITVSMAINQDIKALLLRKEINPDYILQTLTYFGPSVLATCLKSGTTVESIEFSWLKKYKICMPPPLEQEAIAQALSDADGLIEQLEQLIAKKRAIKQGAMQELLTGKKRLPNNIGDWGTRTLFEIADCLDHLRVPLNETQRSKMEGDYPYCGANGVLSSVNAFVIDDNIILIAEDGGYFDEYETRPIAYKMNGKCWVNNHAHILKSKSGYCQDFLYYSLVHKNILSFLASGTRAKLNKSEMWKIEISLPTTIEEQQDIASILSDMDSEISSLEEKLAKARAIKSGMMHELLTGKTRLV